MWSHIDSDFTLISSPSTNSIVCLLPLASCALDVPMSFVAKIVSRKSQNYFFKKACELH